MPAIVRVEVDNSEVVGIISGTETKHNTMISTDIGTEGEERRGKSVDLFSVGVPQN